MLPEQARLMAESGAPRFAIFALIKAKGGPVRAWTGFGDFEVHPDDMDVEGGVYQGIGLVGDVPALRQLIGGTAERVEFTLSGSDAKTLSLADEQADTVIAAPVHIGVVFFDPEWQATPIAWVWDGTADMPSVDRDGAGGQVVRQVKLSVGTAYTDRTRPRLSFWTDADQKRRSSDDDFCARVAGYSIDSTIKWPG